MARRLLGLGWVLLPIAGAALLRLLWLDAIPYGWHYDEAIMGVLAQEVCRGVQRPIFFAAYGGQEPLYVYLGAGMMALLGTGQSVLALRITSALLGIATVGVTYLLGRELFGRRVAWLATALIAISFYHVMHSRLGLRTISQPLLEALTIYLLLRAARNRSLALWIGAGVSFGATAYTYLAARAFPMVFVLYALWWMATHGVPSRRTLLNGGIFLAAAAIAFGPLGLYFLQHPGDFFLRINQIFVLRPEVSQEVPGLSNLGGNLVKALGIFTFAGDRLWRYNIPSRPMFVGGLALLFYLGLLRLLRGTWRRDQSCAMVLSWLIAMLLPTFPSYDVGAYSLRAMGVLPAVFFLPALGLDAAYGWLKRQTAFLTPTWRLAAPALVGSVLLWDGTATFRDYFLVWPRDFATAIETGYDLVVQARFLEAHANDDATLFASSADYHLPVLSQLAPGAYPRLRWFDGNQCLVLPPDAGDAIYSFPYTALPLAAGRYLPGEAIIDLTLFDAPEKGHLLHLGYRLTAEQVRAEAAGLLRDAAFQPLYADWGPAELLAYSLARRVEAGKTLPLTLVWRVKAGPQPQDLFFYAHLLDHWGQMRGQGDANGFPPPEWQPGDVVIGRYDIQVPLGAPPGRYIVDIGLYDRATQEVFAAMDDKGRRVNLNLGAVKVASPPLAVPTPSQWLSRQLGHEVRLIGFDLERRAEALTLTLYWEAMKQLRRDYTVFVHLLDAEGRLLAQSDAMPAEGSFPTSFWEPDEVVIDSHRVPLAGLEGGRHLVVGMYLLASGERLRAPDGADSIFLAAID